MADKEPSNIRAQLRRLNHYFRHCGRGGAHVSNMDAIDLSLLGDGLVEKREGTFSTTLTVTDKGISLLHEQQKKNAIVRSVHHSLGARLAESLRRQGRITWENIEFKNQHIDQYVAATGKEIEYQHWECVRPDVFSIKPSLQLKYANPCIYEIKASRADFLGDIARPEKREAYAKMAEAVYYVAREGLIKPDEVPEGFGLMVERKEGEFVLAKRAKRRKIVLEAHHYLNMIIKPGTYPEDYGF